MRFLRFLSMAAKVEFGNAPGSWSCTGIKQQLPWHLGEALWCPLLLPSRNSQRLKVAEQRTTSGGTNGGAITSEHKELQAAAAGSCTKASRKDARCVGNWNGVSLLALPVDADVLHSVVTDVRVAAARCCNALKQRVAKTRRNRDRARQQGCRGIGIRRKTFDGAQGANGSSVHIRTDFRPD